MKQVTVRGGLERTVLDIVFRWPVILDNKVNPNELEQDTK